AVQKHLGPVHLAISADADNFERLLHGREPGAFGAAVAVRELVVDPAPTWTNVALGADVLRSFVVGLRRAFDDVDFTPLLSSLGVRGGPSASDAFFSRLIGFDPSDALTRVVDRLRNDE